MDGLLIRIVVLVVVAVVLGLQARAAQGQPHRQRAFLLASGALISFALYNLSFSLGLGGGPVPVILTVVNVALLLGAIVSYAFSVRSGELRGQYQRLNAEMEEFRKREIQRREARRQDEG